MSLKAMAWAIDQHCGSPSAKVTLWAIANHAGSETWVTWAAQSYYVEETEQSPDSVQRRIPELEEAGLIRRMPLRYDGRKSTDLFILRPSQFWDASIEEIEKLLPRGMSVDHKFAVSYMAARCGCDENATEQPHETPQTQPQPAENVAATVRSQEPENKPENLNERDARVREGQEAEPHVPHHDLLARLIVAHPQSAHDSVADTHAAWRKLTPAERHEAVNRFEEWLGAKGARKAIAGLPMYLNEKRWTMLGEKSTAAQVDLARSMVAPFTRAWWWLFVEAVRKGMLGEAKRYAGLAKIRVGWKIDPAQRDAIEEASKALRQIPKDGPEVEQWRSHYRERGIDLPIPDAATWLFLPASMPALTP